MRGKLALAVLALSGCSVAAAWVALARVEVSGRAGALAAGLAVAAAGALLAWVALARAVLRPLERLAVATRVLARGELRVPVEVPGAAGLARDLEAMRVGVRAREAALQAEIEERKRTEARLLHDAFHDPLTGLPNRALFVDRLEHVIRSAGRHPDERYALLFVDLDRFKEVNDALGHLAGDRLLVAAGAHVAACLRPGDSVARLGGDEFGVLLEGIRGPADALHVADRIQKELAALAQLEGHAVAVTASIGIAIQCERYARPDEVLRDADVAMYQAKLCGRGRCEIFDAEMHGTAVQRMLLEADLRRAVERREEFLLEYQPIVALGSGSVIGVEALVRWRHPARGLLSADEFVPLAEECGAIVPLGEWIVRAACAQLRSWQERVPALGDAILSVNLSARQFRRPECVDIFRRIVVEEGVDPRLLAVEVTETVLMDDAEASAAKLAQLRDIGIHVHVDDFGTGYSSLSYLHRLPIAALKIDRSFVAGLPGDAECEDVVRTIVSIAESLDLDVIAEGIEDERQAARLQELRCRYGQGYLVTGPLEATALEAWLALRSRSVA